MKLTQKQSIQVGRIMDLIYTDGPLSRIDLSNALNITPATMSELTQHLLENALISEVGEASDDNKAGRKKVLLEVQSGHSYYLGVELSERWITLCIMDNTAEVVLEKRLATTSMYFNDPSILTKLIEDHMNEVSVRIDAIGIAIPGHYDRDSITIQTNNPLWQLLDLKFIKNSFRIPVYFENNVNCMSIYERLFSPEDHDSNFIFLHFRRGIYCSYIYDSKVYAKNNFAIGEIGHFVMSPIGETCECGKNGCLQTVASESWLIKKAQTLYSSSIDSMLSQLVEKSEDITIDTLLDAYKLGDRGVIAILHNAMTHIAIFINNLLVINDAEVIYLHGALFTLPELRDYMESHLKDSHSLFTPINKVKKVYKNYTRMNGAVGAAAICISKILANDY